MVNGVIGLNGDIPTVDEDGLIPGPAGLTARCRVSTPVGPDSGHQRRTQQEVTAPRSGADPAPPSPPVSWPIWFHRLGNGLLDRPDGVLSNRNSRNVLARCTVFSTGAARWGRADRDDDRGAWPRAPRRPHVAGRTAARVRRRRRASARGSGVHQDRQTQWRGEQSNSAPIPGADADPDQPCRLAASTTSDWPSASLPASAAPRTPNRA